jgi:hypothetical protein
MAQNAQTVTNPNPTPPTNLVFVGSTPPNPLNYDPTCYDNPHGVNSGTPPYFDDGVTNAQYGQSFNEPSLSRIVFAANHAALAVGGTSVAHEGAGTEQLFTQTYSANVLAPIPLTAVSAGAVYTTKPNQDHASSLSPATNPTLASIAPTSSVHGTAAVTMTATGVGFNKQSKIVIGGVPQATTFVSSTSLTCTATPGAAAGTTPVTVQTGGVVGTAPQTWTFT